jgi:acetyl esterase/lipase
MELIPCLIIVRGGGYKIRGGLQGFELANAHRVAVCDVAYTVVKDLPKATAGAKREMLWPKPFVDLARAVRIVRARASEWGLRSDRIGCFGFSAGGHLVGLLASGRELAPPPVPDALLDGLSFVPDFVGLSYPLISVLADELQSDATRNAVGVFLHEEASGEEREELSAHRHVHAAYPPTFIWHCEDDAIVPVAQARAMADSLAAAGVPVELHVYPTGGHAIGFALSGPHANDWVERFCRWLARLR